MKILISLFLFFIMAILTSKIKINIRYLEKNANSFAIRFKVNIGFYLFGFFKILGLTLKESGMEFLFLKIPYNKMKIDKDSIKILKDFSVLNMVKSLSVQLDKLNLRLKIGSEDMMLTVFSVFAISTFLSILSAKNRKNINLKNYAYQITPIYNTNFLSFQISSKISIKMYSILQTLRTVKKSDKKVYRVHMKKVPLKI